MINTNYRMEDREVASVNKNFVLEDRCITMADRYITMVLGDTLSFGVEIRDQNGVLMDIDDAVFVAKKQYNSATAVFEKTLGDGITKDSTGRYVVRVAPEDTADAEAGWYYYGFRVEKNGDIYTIMRGIIELEPEVSANESV